MKLNRLSSALLIALFATSGFNLVRADEGMWTFNNVPRAEIKKKYGFEVTDAWLKKVQLATVRFNSGGTGSFVSAGGVGLTNHHNSSYVLPKISTPQNYYKKERVFAHNPDQKVKAPGLPLKQLVSIEDV